MKLELIEPLRELFKDEGRQVGFELGLSREIVMRQPFPGPGLAVRILGEITRDRLEVLRSADGILLEEIRKADLYEKVWQSFAVLLPVRTAVQLAVATGEPAVVYPNTGETYADGAWTGTPHFRPGEAVSWARAGATYIGGCCRVGPAEIALIASEMSHLQAEA